MAEKARYVDVDKLKIALMNIYPAMPNSYSSSLIETQVNQLIGQGLFQALESFKQQLITAVDQAAAPYDKCMLCVQRDSCIPEHPLGDNR